MEQVDYNLLYRWFVGLGVDDPVWVPTVFTNNRDRLLEADVARKFLAELMDHKELRALLSDEHFSSTARRCAGGVGVHEELKAKDGSSESPAPAAMASVIFTARSAATLPILDHRSGGAALPQGPGQGSQPSFMGHTLMENRNGPAAAALTKATGTAERSAAEEMIVRHSPGASRITLGADKGLRRGSVRRRHARPQRDAPYCTEHQRTALCHRRAHHTTSRLCREPEEAKAHRGAIRLGQDDRRAFAADAPGGRKLGLSLP